MKDFTSKEIEQYQTIINNHREGTFELKEIFASIWDSIKPTTFGKQFKMSYEKYTFFNITYVTLRGDNHNMYTITTTEK